MDDIRIVECERCGGDGGWGVFFPDERSTWVRCPSCNGVGEYVMSVSPVTLEDLDELAELERAA